MEILYQENLQKANVLKKQLDKFRPLTPEMEERIMQKFRLDWNYHSSNIEGNKLTYGETKALILFGHTAQGKPLKDHLEISGHNEAIMNIEEVIKQKRPLTEKFIRELHKIILKKPYEIDAITPDGKPTKKMVHVGQYKTTPNHVKTSTGEIFYFATPEETPAKMNDLINWYDKGIKRDNTDIILFATEYHYRFIRIHPFDDGNGRIARLLMNFILMQKAYPPAIIKTQDKNNYFDALQQADAGNLEHFFNYICEREIESLEMMISGAQGKKIEEDDDLDKKLELLKAKIGQEPKEKIKTERSPEVIKNILEKSIMPFVEAMEERLKSFDSFFKSRKNWICLDAKKIKGSNNIFSLFNTLKNGFLFPNLDKNIPLHQVGFQARFIDLRSSEDGDDLSGLAFKVTFHDFVYEISGAGLEKPMSRLYHQHLTKTEIKDIMINAGDWQYKLLEELLNR